MGQASRRIERLDGRGPPTSFHRLVAAELSLSSIICCASGCSAAGSPAGPLSCCAYSVSRMSSLTMLASACGCGGPRVQVRPVLTSETAATTVPPREETYEAAGCPERILRLGGGRRRGGGPHRPRGKRPPTGGVHRRVPSGGRRPGRRRTGTGRTMRRVGRITSLDRCQQHARRGTAGPQHAQGLHAPGGRRLHLPASRRGPARPRHVPVQAARGAHQNLMGRVATGAADYAGRTGQFLDVKRRFALP